MREELLHHARALCSPIDFAELEKAGLLRPHGKMWMVPNLNDLPENVRLKVKTMKLVKGGVCVTFYKPSKQLMKLVATEKPVRKEKAGRIK